MVANIETAIVWYCIEATTEVVSCSAENQEAVSEYGLYEDEQCDTVDRGWDRRDPHTERIVAGLSAMPSKTQHGNVLVIEDDADSSESLCTLLVSSGFGVRAVASRDAALLALDNNLYDVVLMDLYMPGLGADDFIKHLRRHYSRTRLIVVSGADRLPELAEELGVHVWFHKPYDFNDILEELQQKPSHDEIRGEQNRQDRNQNREGCGS